MDILEKIESQISATGLPLFAVTLAAVPCPDTPIILTLHWHAFVREKLIEDESANPVMFRPIPSSALQVNERWNHAAAVDAAAMEAAWGLGAWDVARAERPSCDRPGAQSRETLECIQAFGTFPLGMNGTPVVVSDAPDAEELRRLAAQRGYMMWLFRPVHGGIWKDYADDATLKANGTRVPPCPVAPIMPTCESPRKTVYRFGIANG